MYKAIKDIGGYKVGEVVPDEKAKLWLKRYSVPQVEEIAEDTTGQDSNSEPEEKEKSEPETEDVMIDDYLGRNTSVVKKNVEEDNLSQKQLGSLLELEKSDKKRRVIIRAIEKKLNKIED